AAGMRVREAADPDRAASYPPRSPSHAMPTTLWVVLIAVAGALIGTAALLVNGWSFDGAISAASWTARWSFIWFLLAWCASSLATLWPGGWRRQLLRRRRAAGISFAAAHVVHAVFFTTAILVFGVERPV